MFVLFCFVVFCCRMTTALYLLRYRRHGISEELDWKTSLVLERFSNLWTESFILTSGYEDFYFDGFGVMIIFFVAICVHIWINVSFTLVCAWKNS